MDASALEELVYDPSKCNKLNMEQKRELVYEMSKWADDATEMLSAWSRQEILQILCAELGKERKYTGLTKSKMIELLLKIINEKKLQERRTPSVSEGQVTAENGERTPKRQRKSDHPNRLPVAALCALDIDSGDIVYCKNSACRAIINRVHAFCQRCSCCICRQYDDNKDPSLWLICNSDPPFQGVSCGMSFHLECTLRHENSCMSKNRQEKGLDGRFSCVSCGKVNDLLRSWRKQLVVASDTRRVDILCYRLSLARKILAGTELYKNLYGVIEEAVKMLEEEVGPLTGLPVKKARGIVNRLASGTEIQKLCATAVESLDLMLSGRGSDMPFDGNTCPSKTVRFEDISASSLTVVLNSDDSNKENAAGHLLWHRKADDVDYPSEPTARLFAPNITFQLSGLCPATQYFLKVISLDKDCETVLRFRTRKTEDGVQNLDPKDMDVEIDQSPATNCSILSNPSLEDETNNSLPRNRCFMDHDDRTLLHSVSCPNQVQKELPNGEGICLLNEEQTVRNVSFIEKSDTLTLKNKETSIGQMWEETSTDNGLDTPQTGSKCLPCPCVDSSEDGLKITPCNMENVNVLSGWKSRKRISRNCVDFIPKWEEEPQAGGPSKKRNGERPDDGCSGIDNKDFEYCVKVIRWLECDGHLETSFREKFLTWYSMRATPREVKIVKVFVDMFSEDPNSLAEQLVDTFSDLISNKGCSTVPSGICFKLWH